MKSFLLLIAFVFISGISFAQSDITGDTILSKQFYKNGCLKEFGNLQSRGPDYAGIYCSQTFFRNGEPRDWYYFDGKIDSTFSVTFYKNGKIKERIARNIIFTGTSKEMATKWQLLEFNRKGKATSFALGMLTDNFMLTEAYKNGKQVSSNKLYMDQ